MWIVAYILLHLAVYSIFRLQFMVWNWDSLQFYSPFEVPLIFLHGLHFDLSTIAATSIFFLLPVYWLHRFRIAKLVLFAVFWLLNVSLFILNCADTELVNFTARRFTKASLYLLGEGQNMNIIGAYLGIALFGLAIIAAYSYFTLLIYRKAALNIRTFQKLGLTFLTLVISIVAFRGGLQSKPIMPVDGRIFPDQMANQMVLNSTFTLMKSLDKPTIEREHYFDTEKMLSYLNRPNAYPLIKPPLPKANIVIVLLESFSREYTELNNPDFTPYLNQLARNGAYFQNFYANSKTSISGVPAVLAGVPALMDDPFIDSEFSLNHFPGLAATLAKQGYHSSFFHGANKNSMHFDAFSKGAGFQHHFSREDYPDTHDDDGKWGIYDGPFLNWVCGKFSDFPEPFVSSVFTLSSHQPYSVPEAERSEHPDGNHPILKSIHYTDASLQSFMKCASVQPWFKNTIFVFTADHAGPALKPGYPFAKQFEIPLILYTANPDVLKSMETSQYAQQIDILPTLFETVGIVPKEVNHLARSLWHPGSKVIPLYLDGTFELLGLSIGVSAEIASNTKNAVRQYFSEGMLDDHLYLGSEH